MYSFLIGKVELDYKGTLRFNVMIETTLNLDLEKVFLGVLNFFIFLNAADEQILLKTVLINFVQPKLQF